MATSQRHTSSGTALRLSCRPNMAKMPVKADALLGRIAVHLKLITMEQLSQATATQGRNPGKRLGAILVEAGFITQRQLAQVLAAQKRYLAHQREKQQAAIRQPPKPPKPTHPPPPSEIALDLDLPTQRSTKEQSAPMQSAPQQSSARAAGEQGSEFKIELDIDGSTPEPTTANVRAGRPGGQPAVAPGEQSSARAREQSADRGPGLELDAPAPGQSPMEQTLQTRVDKKAAPQQPQPEAKAVVRVQDGRDRSAAHERSKQAAGGSKQLKWLHTTLAHAARAKASDILFHAGTKARMRRFSKLIDLTDRPIPPSSTDLVLRAALNEEQRERFEQAGEVDLAYEVPDVGRFRANIYRQHSGTNGVFHFIPSSPPKLAELGLPMDFAKLTNFPQGLLLLTGPGGCGKTSTMAALINIINEERSDHILTIEDPIEYVHRSNRCLVNQRQVGDHTESFARALRAALREDPDVICIGELRDLETISLALSAAETGHLVLATLHTNSTIRTINRIVGAYPPSQQSQIRSMLSESLRAVISQRLLPRDNGNGVVVAYELLHVSKAVGNLIRENRSFQIHSVLQTGRAQGMCLLDDSLAELVKAGHIHEHDAAIHANDPKRFSQAELWRK